MQNNIETNLKPQQSMLCWEKLELITSFFFTYSNKAIKTNAKQLSFWQKVLTSSDLMDDLDHRKEFNRILEMNEALAALIENVSDRDILQLLEFVSQGKSITNNILEQQKKEVSHE